MAALYAGRNVDPEAMYQRMKVLMDAEGLPYGRRTHTYNSRLAQELGTWAETHPGGGAPRRALPGLFRRRAEHRRSRRAGGDRCRRSGCRRAARAVLSERRFKDAVDADWAKSNAYGVTGVPTFVAGGYGVVGAQPYEVLVQLLDQAGAPRRSWPARCRACQASPARAPTTPPGC